VCTAAEPVPTKDALLTVFKKLMHMRDIAIDRHIANKNIDVRTLNVYVSAIGMNLFAVHGLRKYIVNDDSRDLATTITSAMQYAESWENIDDHWRIETPLTKIVDGLVDLFDALGCPVAEFSATQAVQKLTSGLETLSPKELVVRGITLVSIGKAQALAFALASVPSDGDNFKAGLHATVSALTKVTGAQLNAQLISDNSIWPVLNYIEKGRSELAAADQSQSRTEIFRVLSELKPGTCRQ
jgi:hypothetical protein